MSPCKSNWTGGEDRHLLGKKEKRMTDYCPVEDVFYFSFEMYCNLFSFEINERMLQDEEARGQLFKPVIFFQWYRWIRWEGRVDGHFFWHVLVLSIKGKNE